MNKIAYECACGLIEIVEENDAITYIKKISKKTKEHNGQSLLLKNVCKQLDEYFQGKRKVFDFEMHMQGTEFQMKVWKALCDIPYGETRSYKDIAKAVGSEKACRAVGTANGKNPISIVVPCHRVINENGDIGGYSSGLDMKEILLALEKKQY